MAGNNLKKAPQNPIGAGDEVLLPQVNILEPLLNFLHLHRSSVSPCSATSPSLNTAAGGAIIGAVLIQLCWLLPQPLCAAQSILKAAQNQMLGKKHLMNEMERCAVPTTDVQ